MPAMARALPWICGLGLLVFLVSAAWLGQLEQSGPAHGDVVLEGGVPATFYLPRRGGREVFEDLLPRGERPPAVVLMHGFASDRLGMSALARRLADAGYAVLAFDASGHGQNRNPFQRSRARVDAFMADYSAAVDFLRGTPMVDGERIAVMGHSMGAGASLDFATRDSGIDATVLISGGWTLHGPHRPPNALFLYATGDPGRLKERSRGLAAQLAGVDSVELGKRYGDPRLGSAVRVVEVPGADHATIVWTGTAAREIRDWLDAAFGIAPRTDPIAPEPRFTAALLCALAMLVVLPGVGLVIGRLVPRAEERSGEGAFAGLGWLALGLVATMPLLAADTPASQLSIEVGDVIVSHFALTGIALLVVATLRGETPLAGILRAPAPHLVGATVGVIAAYLLSLPLGVVVHRITLTPERTVVFVASALALLPFAFAFQWLLRRGPPARASLVSALGRVLVLGALALGVATGLLSFVVILILPALALVFVLIELLASSIYATSRNLTVIALIDAPWLAFIVAASMPIRS